MNCVLSRYTYITWLLDCDDYLLNSQQINAFVPWHSLSFHLFVCWNLKQNDINLNKAKCVWSLPLLLYSRVWFFLSYIVIPQWNENSFTKRKINYCANYCSCQSVWIRLEVKWSHVLEQFGALCMHNLDDKYSIRSGFEPSTSEFRASTGTNEPSKSFWIFAFYINNPRLLLISGS